jgi:hypothetical protein
MLAPPASSVTDGRLQTKKPKLSFRLKEKPAATYSRASYTGTTIGNAVFDGRVRDGIGSDHSFIATKKTVATLNFTTWRRRGTVLAEQRLRLPTVQRLSKSVFSENYT